MLWTIASAFCMASVVSADSIASSPRIAIVDGVLGTAADDVQYILSRRDIQVDRPPGRWLAAKDYANYDMVVIAGDVDRSKIEPSNYSGNDLALLKTYLESGGVLLWLNHDNGTISNAPDGPQWWTEMFGRVQAIRDVPEDQRDMKILLPAHPWVQSLKTYSQTQRVEASSTQEGDAEPWTPWLDIRGTHRIAALQGQAIIGDGHGRSILWTAPVGKGRIIVLGWDLNRHTPNTRKKFTTTEHAAFEAQQKVLGAILASVFPDTFEKMPWGANTQPAANWPLNVQPYPAVVQSKSPLALGPASGLKPLRPLPVPVKRPLADSLASAPSTRFVNPVKGSDKASGSKDQPWATINFALTQINPGDTLVLRGGRYFERVKVNIKSLATQPTTIRAYPGEVPVIDGSERQFLNSPTTAWEPVPDGANGEYRSTATFENIDAGDRRVNVVGWYADTLVPLHGYLFHEDLVSNDATWTLNDHRNHEAQAAIYCGPGVWLDPQTRRIHIRLKLPDLPGLDMPAPDAVITDPRKLSLHIALNNDIAPLDINGATNLHILDVVVLGSTGTAVNMKQTSDIKLDGLSIYCGSSGIVLTNARRIRIHNTAIRGRAASWTSRAALKYRSYEAKLINTGTSSPRDVEDVDMAYCEMTDSVDGVMMGNIRRVWFRFNVLDNTTDDGLFLTALSDVEGRITGGPASIHHNHLSRSLTMFAFGAGRGRQRQINNQVQTGAGVWIYRNFIDLREPIYKNPPKREDDGSIDPLWFSLRDDLPGDHGSPTWEPIYFYQNSVLAADSPWRRFYMAGLGGRGMRRGISRWIINNAIVNIIGAPGRVLVSGQSTVYAASNLNWSVDPAMAQTMQSIIDELANRQASVLELEQLQPLPAMRAKPIGDRWAPPGWQEMPSPEKPVLSPVNVTPLHSAQSPLIDAGMKLPASWPNDPVTTDDGRPDIGAVPAGGHMWPVGIGGRYQAGDIHRIPRVLQDNQTQADATRR